MLRVTVSGSFRRHMDAIHDAVKKFTEFGIAVLSPSDPRIVEQIGEFVFVASDRVRSIKMVEDRHLECIRASDFLWLVAPDGYVGQSASMELGYAIAHGVPILCEELPVDGTLRRYVCQVGGIGAALSLAYATRRGISAQNTFLMDPVAAVDRAQDHLDSLRQHLARSPSEIRDSRGETVLAEQRALRALFAPAATPVDRAAAV